MQTKNERLVWLRIYYTYHTLQIRIIPLKYMKGLQVWEAVPWKISDNDLTSTLFPAGNIQAEELQANVIKQNLIPVFDGNEEAFAHLNVGACSCFYSRWAFSAKSFYKFEVHLLSWSLLFTEHYVWAMCGFMLIIKKQ